jgi:hypothetical protein
MSADDDCIFGMIKYYDNAKGGVPQPVADKVYSVLMGVNSDVRKKAIDWMYEHCKKNYGLDLSDLFQAIREAKGYDSPYIKTETWKCEVCGYDFQFHPCPSEDDMFFKGIFDRCPR